MECDKVRIWPSSGEKEQMDSYFKKVGEGGGGSFALRPILYCSS